MRYQWHEDLLFLHWKQRKDKQSVSIISTMHKANDQVVVNCHIKQDGKHVVLELSQPLAISDYNQFMGSMDVLIR